MEGRHSTHVEPDRREVGAVAPQQGGDAIERALHIGRRRCFLRLGKALPQAGLGRRFARLRKLQAEQPTPTPGDPAAPDRRFEE
jgi:hypothetical protein